MTGSIPCAGAIAAAALAQVLVSPAQAQGRSEPDITVVVTSQDAQGVTQKSFDLRFLQLMEGYVVERTRIKAKEYLASIGKGDQRVELTSEATYVEVGAKKLIVIRITDQQGVGGVTIAGLVGAELKRVTCAKNSPGAPPISFGPCGKKVAEVFGVKL